MLNCLFFKNCTTDVRCIRIGDNSTIENNIFYDNGEVFVNENEVSNELVGEIQINNIQVHKMKITNNTATNNKIIINEYSEQNINFIPPQKIKRNLNIKNISADINLISIGKNTYTQNNEFNLPYKIERKIFNNQFNNNKK